MSKKESNGRKQKAALIEQREYNKWAERSREEKLKDHKSKDVKKYLSNKIMKQDEAQKKKLQETDFRPQQQAKEGKKRELKEERKM